ncbi:MAG: Ig-like domain-containing protein [Cytophagales bacterium]|nr:Ig-like domain-containing protein [Cytophagales bacterium]
MKLTKQLTILALLAILLLAGCNQKDDDPGIRPEVLSTNPITNSIDEAVNTHVTATFSVAMDPASITNTTFTLQKAGASVDGTTSYAGTTATFTPTENLSPNTLYTATITKAVKSTTG